MRARLVLFVGLVFVWSGCGAGLKSLEIPDEEAVYDAPLEEVWPGVRQFFTDHQLSFREDKGGYRLQTEWREEFGGSRVSGFWHRYLVVGQRETPTRSKLWVIRVTRSANRTLAVTGSELDWGMNRSLGVGSGGGGGAAESVAGTGSTTALSIEDLADATDKPRQDIAVQDGSAQSSRDLVMEWKVFRAVAPMLARAAPAASESRPALVTPAAPSPLAVECGRAIIGLAAQVQPGHVLLLGDLQGTQEVPRFVAQGACQTASQGLPVTVGLEWPASEQARVTAFLHGPGDEAAERELLNASFWRNPYPDGRSSQAMARLLRQLRQLRAQGLDVDVFVFDHPGTEGQAREERMTATVLSHVKAHPERAFLVLSGNLHVRARQGVSWDARYRPLGLLLSRQHAPVRALDLAYATGTAWLCTVGEGSQGLSCGVRATRGKDNGERFFVHLFGEKPNAEGYHGIFYVGPVTASPPEVDTTTGPRVGAR